jgi:hypothetical protein
MLHGGIEQFALGVGAERDAAVRRARVLAAIDVLA